MIKFVAANIWGVLGVLGAAIYVVLALSQGTATRASIVLLFCKFLCVPMTIVCFSIAAFKARDLSAIAFRLLMWSATVFGLALFAQLLKGPYLECELELPLLTVALIVTGDAVTKYAILALLGVLALGGLDVVALIFTHQSQESRWYRSVAAAVSAIPIIALLIAIVVAMLPLVSLLGW